MATILKRAASTGEVSYQVKIRLKGHPAQSATFARLTDAKKWGKQTEAAILEGRHFKTSEAKRRTLGELVDAYTRDVLPDKKDKAARTGQLTWWKEQLGSYALADIRPVLIAEYRDKLAKEPRITPTGRELKRTPATVNRYLAALSAAFTWAVKERQWLEDNPLAKVTKPKEPRGRVRFLSDEERAALLQACRGSSNGDLYLAVVLALSTGARQQEVMGLRWPDVDLSRGIITRHETKNGERRALPLAGHALELVRERGKVSRIDTDLLFPSSVHPQQPVDLRQPFTKALKAAGIENFRWHDLRHSAASYLAMSGASLAEIAEVLGHKTLSMVKRYAHLSEQHTAAVVSKMNAAIFGG